MLVDWVVGSDTCNVGCPEVNIFFDPWAFLYMFLEECTIWITTFGEICLLQRTDATMVGPPVTTDPTDPIFIWNATVGLNFFNDSSYDILGNSPTFRTKFIIYPFYTQFQHGVLIRRGSLASYPFDVYYALLFVLVIWPYSPMFQIPVRSIRLCSRGINKQVCFPGPEFGISTNRCELPLSVSFYHLTNSPRATSELQLVMRLKTIGTWTLGKVSLMYM